MAEEKQNKEWYQLKLARIEWLIDTLRYRPLTPAENSELISLCDQVEAYEDKICPIE